MKIVILHQDLEWAEKEIQHQLLVNGIKAKLFDVQTTNESQILNYVNGSNFKVINRVYASVANRNYRDNLKVLDLLFKFEKKGIFCINSFKTSLFDYNKFESYKQLKDLNIFTPETVLLERWDKKTEKIVNSFVEKYGFPIILKRNMGGRGKGMKLLKNYDELLEAVKFIFSEKQKQDYGYGFVLQEFIRSNKNHDVRIGILNGEVVSVMARTLISIDSEVPWLASVSLGSVALNSYESSQEEIELAKKATLAIGATFNIVDLMLTDNGPCLIENNPTPQYVESNIAKQRINALIDLVIAS